MSSPLLPVGMIDGHKDEVEVKNENVDVDANEDEDEFEDIELVKASLVLTLTSVVGSAGGWGIVVTSPLGGRVWISIIDPVASMISTTEMVSTMTTLSEVSRFDAALLLSCKWWCFWC